MNCNMPKGMEFLCSLHVLEIIGLLSQNGPMSRTDLKKNIANTPRFVDIINMMMNKGIIKDVRTNTRRTKVTLTDKGQMVANLVTTAAMFADIVEVDE